MKCQVYAASLIRYALSLRCTSLPAFELLLDELKLLSLSFLSKSTFGNIGAVTSAKVRREKYIANVISDDVMLLFHKIYLQMWEEYVGEDTDDVSKNGDLCKGMIYFMIVGLESNVPCVLKTVPGINIKWEWL